MGFCSVHFTFLCWICVFVGSRFADWTGSWCPCDSCLSIYYCISVWMETCMCVDDSCPCISVCKLQLTLINRRYQQRDNNLMDLAGKVIIFGFVNQWCSHYTKILESPQNLLSLFNFTYHVIGKSFNLVIRM